MNLEKQFYKFTQLVPKLDAVQFLGLALLMGVEIKDEVALPRKFENILSDVLDAYVAAEPSRRKELMKIVKAGAKRPGVPLSET